DSLWPALALGFVFILHFHLALTRSINWDEFHFLGQVHTFVRGELTLPLQSLHVRMFAWLAPLDMAGVDQIRIARMFMLAAEAVTCASITLIARRFVSLPYALTCALAYVTAAYVVQHGWSFRTDPIATAFSMSALAILARSKFSMIAIAAFALLMGTAFMVTMKIVLFAPAFAGIAWMRWSEAGFQFKRALQIAAGPVIAIGVAAVIYALHSLSLAPADKAAEMVSHSGESMFKLGLSKNLRYLSHGALFALPFVMALIITPFALKERTDVPKAKLVAILGLAAMTVTPLYYINSFPYFYAFMLAPIAAGLGFGIKALSERYGHNVVLAVFAGWGLMVWFVDGESHLDKQRTIQIAAAQMFDEPVNYLDFPNFLPRHRKANSFLSGWGKRNYIAGKGSKFTETLSKTQVPMLAAVEREDNPFLLSAMTDIPRGYSFFDEDLAALKTTYRQVWGPLYVAGTTLKAGETRDWQVWVPGPYKADAAITVNGAQYAAGDIVTLERGSATLTAPENAPTGLLWGTNTRVPTLPVPERPYWTDF
ncbi:MAG: hypothetical protein ABJJ48_08080, partial [Marinomonas sp.]